MNTNMKMRLAALPLFVAASALTAVSGCGDELENPLCCNEGDFQVGGTISGDGEITVALQAVADIGGIAAASIDDLTTACRSMAEGLGASTEERKAAEDIQDKRERMDVYCNLAISAIATVKAEAGGTLTLEIKPPQCSASISAKANCQGSCSVEGECDIQANPPTCEGGKLQVSCSGGCTASGGASVSCQGSCSGSCEGECTAEGGVECAGKCEGTCTASGMGGGTGIQADGTCDGTCSGTCEVTAPSASCSGSCNGSCSATCQAEAGVNVQCDGSCDADFEPIKCEGGELKGGCTVEAKCEANCDASVKAKAECTPPSVNIAFSGSANVQAAGKLKAVLEANLGLVASIEARIGGLVDVTGTLVGNINADFLAEIKVACIPVIIAALGNAAADVQASASASVSIVSSI